MAPPSPDFGETAAKHLGSKEKVGEMFDQFDSNFSGSSYKVYNYRADLSSQME